MLIPKQPCITFKGALVDLQHTEQAASEAFCGEVEVDESYFGGARKGNRGRGISGKTPIFELLKRDTKVYTQIIQDTKGSTLIFDYLKERYSE